ncbi:MAG: class I SAM-dependent methyltransferase [Candidatus Paceibacterota bacterium]|jgi:ubiquinone/menaquinone biosynthesis C-methylase UbiE
MENHFNKEKHRDVWQKIWQRKNISSRIIDYGRSAYNGFFRRLLKKHLNKETRLLELGCGTSTLTISLANEIKSLVGLDISPEALRLSREHSRELGAMNTEFIEGDCLNVPFENEFDIVWSQGLIEHFDNPATVVEQHYRALKPGGTVLISVPYKWSYIMPWYLITRPKIFRSFWPWTDQIFFTKKDLLAIGKSITPHSKTYLLQPFLLGIVILEIKKFA